jgi:hypothetical protein
MSRCGGALAGDGAGRRAGGCGRARQQLAQRQAAVAADQQVPSTYATKFSGKYLHRTMTGGVGHNLPQEAPEQFVEAVMEVDGFSS